MRVLLLSDLHISPDSLIDRWGNKKYKEVIDQNIKEQYDIVIIAGDLVESGIILHKQENPLKYIQKLFPNKEIFFCLGNHEFANRDYNNVIEYWNKWSDPHVHCLDVQHNFIYNGYNFVGNVLWYDFTLNHNVNIKKGQIIDGWLDKTIENFDPIKENEKCKQLIINHCDKNLPNILITHMVPYLDLNLFSLEFPHSPWNAYSGCEDFLSELKDFNIKYAICGHTHRRVCKEINNTFCINVGNDYYSRTLRVEYMIIDL